MSLLLSQGIDTLELPKGTDEIVRFARDWQKSDAVKLSEEKWQKGIYDSANKKPQIVFYKDGDNELAGPGKMIADYGTVLQNLLESIYQKPMAMVYADLWHYMSPIDNEQRFSQQWHRDPLRRGKLPIKVMLWCHPITEGHGPFQYVNQSRPGEKYFLQENAVCYPDPAVVDARVDAQDITTCLSDKDISLNIAETIGLHRGGNLQSGYTRLCGNWAFYEVPD